MNAPQQLTASFDPPSNGTDTSAAAARSIKGRQRARDLAIVFAFIEREPTTCDAAEVALEMSHQSCSARFNDLQRLGLIYDTGIRRATRSGRSARVYAVRTPSPT